MGLPKGEESRRAHGIGDPIFGNGLWPNADSETTKDFPLTVCQLKSGGVVVWNC